MKNSHAWFMAVMMLLIAVGCTERETCYEPSYYFRIQGTVADEQTGLPIENIHVDLYKMEPWIEDHYSAKHKAGSVTDADGVFSVFFRDSGLHHDPYVVKLKFTDRRSVYAPAETIYEYENLRFTWYRKDDFYADKDAGMLRMVKNN